MKRVCFGACAVIGFYNLRPGRGKVYPITYHRIEICHIILYGVGNSLIVICVYYALRHAGIRCPLSVYIGAVASYGSGCRNGTFGIGKPAAENIPFPCGVTVGVPSIKLCFFGCFAVLIIAGYFYRVAAVIHNLFNSNIIHPKLLVFKVAHIVCHSRHCKRAVSYRGKCAAECTPAVAVASAYPAYVYSFARFIPRAHCAKVAYSISGVGYCGKHINVSGQSFLFIIKGYFIFCSLFKHKGS